MDFQKIYKYSQNLNVLYVEDDKQLREETFDILENFFLSVECAENGQIALDKYNEYKDNSSYLYDIVITDINMPIMDGMALVKEINEINPEQSIIVISAYNESSRLIELIQSGMSNFIMKPLSPSHLMDMLYKTSKQISNQKELLQYREELEEKVQEQAKEILFTQQVSIETIANMIESYDDDTGTHVKRIEGYTAVLVNHMSKSENCPPNLVVTIPFASILHDIGKLLIPKEILTKPAKLDKEEFEIVKSHAKLGADFLEKANLAFKKEFDKDSYLKVARDIAMYHHEKWDGSGYPEGLSAQDIPRCARIVAIADVYDALRSKRVYKDGFTHEKSVDIIKSEREKSFDPELVDIFIDNHKKFEEVFSKLS